VNRAVMAILLVVFCAAFASIVFLPVARATSIPSVTLSPAATSPYHDGQSVSVSVGSNTFFTPNSRVNIIECTDPGGSEANLPTSVEACDGNTTQGPTVIVHSDGSFSLQSYTLYALPSSELGEVRTPIDCNSTNRCVLYVGQNQEDFTQPKIFSAPFTVDPVPSSSSSGSTSGAPSGTSSGSGVSGGASASKGASSGASASSASSGSSGSADSSESVSLSSSTSGALAFTGVPEGLRWLVLIGSSLMLLGAAARRLLERWSS